MKRPWLAGLMPLFAAGVGLRGLALATGLEPVKRLGRPVVSVGNISAGGAGKTPFVIAVAKLLAEDGVRVDVLSRGYGRREKLASRVRMDGTAEEFGDEPVVIAREADVPVYVAAERLVAGQLGELEGARLHLLDDGFQHRQLARDEDIVLVSSEDLGDSLLPGGNLREGRGALRRATVFAVEAGDEAAAEVLARMNAADGLARPIWRYRRRMVMPKVTGPVMAFCGIARPEQYFAGLEAGGLQVAVRRAFPDHYAWSAVELGELAAEGKAAGVAAFVMTAKDQARLGPLVTVLQQAALVRVAGLRVELEDPAAVLGRLRGLMGRESDKQSL